MKINFKNISYLKNGNTIQRKAFLILEKHRLLEILKDYKPLVVGTIPIDVDIKGSDLDILLQTEDFERLSHFLTHNFSKFLDFSIVQSGDSLVCNFDIERLPIELYASRIPTDQQNGYLHMIKEYEILQSSDEGFRQAIKNLKQCGVKTEPAFCRLLQISGDPYKALLAYQVNR